MNRKVFTIEELARAVETSIAEIERLEKEGLFSPSGLTAGDVPFYEEVKREELIKVLQLMEIGYNLSEVKKILSKIGVPGGKRRRGSRGLYLTVGELADRTGAGARTIKHWEEKGIIFPDTHSDGGFRLYSKYYVLFVELIKDLQNFGYKLEEIKEIADFFRLFVDIRDNGPVREPEENLRLLTAMTDKIAVLLTHTDQLKKGIHRWEKYLEEKGKEIARLKERNRRLMQENARKKDRKAEEDKRAASVKAAEEGAS